MSKYIDRAHSITIPDKPAGGGSFIGSVETSHGDIDWKVYGMWITFLGHHQAMIEFGLMEHEWMPGLPGNSISGQTVYFYDDGPRWAGSLEPGRKPRMPKVGITLSGRSGRVRLRFCASPQQIERCNAFFEHEPDHCDQDERRQSPISSVCGNVIYLAPRNAWMAESCQA